MALLQQHLPRPAQGWRVPAWPWRAIAFGGLGAAALLAFYLGVITLAQDAAHALDQLRTDLWFIAPVTTGFGVQIGLFVRLRQLHARMRAGAAVTVGSTGLSGTAMLACCAHHLADVLPVLGFSGVALFLNQWKTPFAALALGMTTLGIAYMTLRLRRLWTPACH